MIDTTLGASDTAQTAATEFGPHESLFERGYSWLDCLTNKQWAVRVNIMKHKIKTLYVNGAIQLNRS